jgi:hypothetical protein
MGVEPLIVVIANQIATNYAIHHLFIDDVNARLYNIMYMQWKCVFGSVRAPGTRDRKSRLRQ